eukprot:5902447-Prymnesium_polylepis.1
MPDNARHLTFRQMTDNARQSADNPTKRPTLRQFRQTGLWRATDGWGLYSSTGTHKQQDGGSAHTHTGRGRLP